MSAKRKAIVTASPQSWEEADALLAEYGTKSNELVRLEAAQEDAVAKVKATYATLAKPLQDRLNEIFDGVEIYATAHRKELTDDGKTKQVKMTAGLFGWRTCPPSIAWAKGFNAQKILDGIDAARKAASTVMLRAILAGFIRTKHEPNKEAMLASPEAAKLVDGVKLVTGVEEFYIDPTQAELAEPK